MPDVELPFTRTEYATRLTGVRTAMAERGIAVLLCTDPSNMAWISGYDGWSFYVHQAVLIGPSGDPIFWGRAMDAVGATKTCYMGTDDIVGYSDDHVMSTSLHCDGSFLAQLIADRGWGDLTMGVEMENYYYSAKAHAVLSAAHQGQIVDATALVNWQRAVKSSAEIAYMRRAARIG